MTETVKALTTAKLVRDAANEMLATSIQWRIDPKHILALCDAVEALTASASEPGDAEATAKAIEWLKSMTTEDWLLLDKYMPDDLRERLRVALAVSPVPASEPEPVAWIVLRNGKMCLPFITNANDAARYRERNPDETLMSLYAGPVPTPDGAEATRDVLFKIVHPHIGNEFIARMAVAEIVAALSHPADGSAVEGKEPFEKADLQAVIAPSNRERQSDGIADTNGQPVGEPVVDPVQHELNLAPAGNSVPQNSARHFSDHPADGWRLVPVEPTEEMIDAAIQAHEPLEDEDDLYRAEFKRTYDAMISAAPAAKPEGE